MCAAADEVQVANVRAVAGARKGSHARIRGESVDRASIGTVEPPEILGREHGRADDMFAQIAQVDL